MKKRKEMDSAEFSRRLDTLVRDAVDYQTTLSPDRIKAVEYYRGEMKDMPPRKNWSKAVSMDLRAAMTKALPSVMRTILGSDKVVEFEPVGEGDEPNAEQATDYMNNYVLSESGATDAIYDGCHDALLLRNGILHWYVDKRVSVVGSEHTGLDEMGLTNLVSDDDVEVIEQRVDESPEGAQYSIKIKRIVRDSKPMLVSVPLDEFLISSDALCEEDATLIGQGRDVSRSDLVAMGYDAKLIEALPEDDRPVYSDVERYSRRNYKGVTKTDKDRENEKVRYYDLYVKIDFDGDGIAELRHICAAGGFNPVNILVNEYASEAPYAGIVSERNPHQWEGISLADDLIPIQQVKTALLRYGQDNVYWQNTRQPIIRKRDIENPEALMAPEFGRPILLSDSAVSARDAITYNDVPFIAGNILEMMRYWDEESSARTGIDDSSAGLPPDALQNVTAKASAMIEQKGIARAEQLVRTMATGGLKKAFRGLLRLIIENQDKARTVRLRDEWVEVDPKSWNADMDAAVNTGLGTGTRERDMLTMQQIMAVQEKLLTSLGPINNPFVSPENVWNAVSALVEASGLRTPTMYFTKPDPEQVKALIESKQNEKPIELQKIEAETQAKQELMQAQMPFEVEKERIKVDAATQKEIAQGKAAVEERQAIAEIEAGAKSQELELKRYEIDEKIKLEREKMQLELQKAHADALADKLMGLNDAAAKGVENSGVMLLDALQSLRNPPKPKPRKVRFKRDANGDLEGAEEYDDDEQTAMVN